MVGGNKRHQRNNFGTPCQFCRRLIGRVAARRMACSRNRSREGGRVGKSECWDGDKRRPGGKMTLCGRRICWVREEGRPGGRMNLCVSYGGD